MRSTPELMQAPDIIAVAARHGAVRGGGHAGSFHRPVERLDIVWLLRALDGLPQAHADPALGGSGRARGLPGTRWGELAVRARSPCADADAVTKIAAIDTSPEGAGAAGPGASPP